MSGEKDGTLHNFGNVLVHKKSPVGIMIQFLANGCPNNEMNSQKLLKTCFDATKPTSIKTSDTDCTTVVENLSDYVECSLSLLYTFLRSVYPHKSFTSFISSSDASLFDVTFLSDLTVGDIVENALDGKISNEARENFNLIRKKRINIQIAFSLLKGSFFFVFMPVVSNSIFFRSNFSFLAYLENLNRENRLFIHSDEVNSRRRIFNAETYYQLPTDFVFDQLLTLSVNLLERVSINNNIFV